MSHVCDIGGGVGVGMGGFPSVFLGAEFWSVLVTISGELFE